MRTLLSAIITGIGFKLGSDIYKAIKKKVGVFADLKDDDASSEAGAQG